MQLSDTSLMLSLVNQDSNANHLEFCIRSALEIGELSPGLEAQISAWAARENLSVRDRTMLNLLQDAIQDGCVQRVQVSG